MPHCTANFLQFGRINRQHIEANFKGGSISSDGGVLLLRKLDKFLGLSDAAASALHDPRNPKQTTHSMRNLVAQRLYGLCSGYEDLNDHNQLRHDPLFQTAVGSNRELASSPTFSRMETRVTREELWALNAVLVDQFVASHKAPPKELVLDVDASDIPLHGNQELKQFHGYYDTYCYLPLYVFCGQAMLACVLRPSRIDGAKHTAAIIKLLVKKLRQHWPQTRFILRGDSGFCRQLLINWCERNQVDYIIGVARNKRLQRIVKPWESVLQEHYEATGEKQRAIYEFSYGASSWRRQRRILTRLEYGSQGINPRFVVTSLAGHPGELYDQLYCQRGEAENRIKEVQLGLFGTRASCQKFLANWFRLMLAGLAYTLMHRFRELALKGTELSNASSQTIRSRLLKIGASIVRNTRKVYVMLASNHPLRSVFAQAARALPT